MLGHVTAHLSAASALGDKVRNAEGRWHGLCMPNQGRVGTDGGSRRFVARLTGLGCQGPNLLRVI